MEQKHVIFLGAGASFGSGYPTAKDLRLIMSSKEEFDARSKRIVRSFGNVPEVAEVFDEQVRSTIELFRDGGFGSVDEFCKLVGRSEHTVHVGLMRSFLRFALGLHNPESTFANSEYYDFIQKLFEPNLVDLRKNITVCSYNYDTYLEFLLLRAVKTRLKTHAGGRYQPEHHTDTFNAVTGGFYHHKDLKWMEEIEDFSLFKLHGSVCFPQPKLVLSNRNGHAPGVPISYEVLFSKPYEERMQRLAAAIDNGALPPVVFPWEIFEDGGWRDEEKFPLQEESGNLLKLFRQTWESAKRAVSSAEKISFIGISVHEFMLGGLEYLFSECAGRKVEVVFVNSSNPNVEPDRMWRPLDYPHLPCGKISRFLKSVGVNPVRALAGGGMSQPTVKPLRTFSDFIEREMG